MKIGFFGYNFPHKKTSSLLLDTHKHGFDVGAVFLAPKKIFDDNGHVISIDEDTHNSEIKAFCKNNNISCYVIDHDDNKAISKIIMAESIDIGLIGGARILKEEVIQLFPNGVINYHPGRIPETSGLDAFYRTIEAKIPLCITAHLIDDKVDAGLFILEQQVEILKNDSFEDIQKRQLDTQIKLNHIVLTGIEKNTFSYPQIHRPKKNKKLSASEKSKILRSFENWKEQYI